MKQKALYMFWKIFYQVCAVFFNFGKQTFKTPSEYLMPGFVNGLSELLQHTV